MLTKVFIELNKFFPAEKFPHPFNIPKNGIQNLNYSDYEFEKAPQAFAHHDKFLKNHAGGDLPAFINYCKGKKVCDFACGGGGKSVYMARFGAGEVYGVDMNGNFIRQSKRIAAEKGVAEKCHFKVAECEKTGLPENYFDIVFLNDTVEHLHNPIEVFIEARRILKPGGQIFINFEAYYYFFGHHLWDAIRIPWLHCFTTEKFRIKLYKEAVKDFPDALERINYRIGRDHGGIERITYLNRITIRRWKHILRELDRHGLKLEHMHISSFRNKMLKALARVPFLDEFFASTIACVLKKV